jgi:hypothetical protein
LRAAFAAALLLCFASSSIGQTATPAVVPGDPTLRIEPLKPIVKEGELIGMLLVFTGGARETILILPMGADASGIISWRATEIASGQEWKASRRDPRSFAADDRHRFPAGARLERRYDGLWFENAEHPYGGELPPGKYRIVATYDEARTFNRKNQTSRVIQSEPVEFEVTAR